jgi:hypothetical protein
MRQKSHSSYLSPEQIVKDTCCATRRVLLGSEMHIVTEALRGSQTSDRPRGEHLPRRCKAAPSPIDWKCARR